MKHPIGFNFRDKSEPKVKITYTPESNGDPVSSIVQVRFPDAGIALSYYNDKFNLKVGDFVFVDGKYAGIRGRIENVTTHFKVKLDDYKRVLSVADVKVMGNFYQANNHIISFEKSALLYEQVRSWFFPPVPEDAEYIVGYDDESFDLHDPADFPVGSQIIERGIDYYHSNKVLCLALDGTHGHAIVEGTKTYELEFEYIDGRISNLICDCPYGANCKHMVAAMLQLRETLSVIEKRYSGNFDETQHFVTVYKPVFFTFSIDGDQEACLKLY